jgi:dTDP-4-dehydrorhamnose reductase
VRVVADQIGTPTWARSLAGALWRTAARPAVSGVHHWTDAGVASWYDFAVAIREEALAHGVLARAAPVQPIDTADYPTPARRPAFSVLDKGPTWHALDLVPGHWRAQLRAMLAELPRG